MRARSLKLVKQTGASFSESVGSGREEQEEVSAHILSLANFMPRKFPRFLAPRPPRHGVLSAQDARVSVATGVEEGELVDR